MCTSPTVLSLVGSSYFIGFALGLFLFQMPNSFGRKRTMNLIMPVYIIASSTIVYYPNLYVKGIGYFIQGLLHLKITLSYTYIFELVPEKNKGISATIINFADAITLGVTGITYMFITQDAVKFTQTVNLIESIAVLIFLVIAPESPSWLILNA